MSDRASDFTGPPARTHAQALALFRRPFAPGAIGFRAMSKTAYTGNPWGGAQVAAFIGAQSVLQRLNCVVPGRWRMDFAALDGDLLAANADTDGRKRLYLACRLTITLPHQPGGPDADVGYEDIGELDAGSLAGLKALYSDARKRAAVAAGIGAYLYTALAAVVRPIGPDTGHVQCIRRAGRSDLLVLSAATEAWLRDGYRQRMATATVLRDLGPILAHGEPDDGIGQGESTDHAARPASEPTATEPPAPARRARPARGRRQRAAARPQRRDRPPGPRPARPGRPARGMSPARQRLAALAAAAGYGPETLGLIADAALPAHQPGERLDDAHIAHIASAVEVLAQAGLPARGLTDVIAHHRERYGETCWREQFWQRQLRTAALRYREPRFYGLSPCEADPARLTEHAVAL